MNDITINIKDTDKGKIYVDQFTRIAEIEPHTEEEKQEFISILSGLLNEPDSVIEFRDKIQLFQLFVSRCHSHQVSFALF